jgi:hypothetical protein
MRANRPAHANAGAEAPAWEHLKQRAWPWLVGMAEGAREWVARQTGFGSSCGGGGSGGPDGGDGEGKGSG